jgi:hypothetical protein
VCGELIQQILESPKPPEEITIVYVPGHQKRVNFEAQGNSFTDEIAKQTAVTPKVLVFCLILYLPALPINPVLNTSWLL